MESARTRLKKILDIDSEDHRTRAALGDLLAAEKKYGEAEKEYNTIRTKAPKIPAGYLKLARLYAHQGDREKAVATIEAGYRENQQSLPLLTGLIQAYLATKQPDRAIGLCRERLEKNPEEVVTHVLLGRIHGSRKDFAKAEAAFEKAITNQARLADRPQRTGPARIWPRAR